MLRAMTVRRLVSVLSVCLVASVTVVVAQPTNDPKAPVAPAKDAPAGSDAGSAVQMTEDPPPEDMEGTNEDPDAPRLAGQKDPEVVAVPKKETRTGYPIEEVLRPITLPQNMSEVSLGMLAQVSPYAGSSTLRARYGITRQVQLGLSYLVGGIYAEKNFIAGSSEGTKLHAGKAVGLDLTVSLQDWLAVRVGVPVYVDPVAVGVTLGAPLRFVFANKLVLGGMEDVVNLKIRKFHPSFQQEYINAIGAANDASNTAQSDGFLRFSGYAIYQHKPNLAFIGRFGVDADLSPGDTGAATSFIRAGLQYSPRRFLDVGGSLGFEDLARGGSFAPAAYVAVRI